MVGAGSLNSLFFFFILLFALQSPGEAVNEKPLPLKKEDNVSVGFLREWGCALCSLNAYESWFCFLASQTCSECQRKGNLFACSVKYGGCGLCWCFPPGKDSCNAFGLTDEAVATLLELEFSCPRCTMKDDPVCGVCRKHGSEPVFRCSACPRQYHLSCLQIDAEVFSCPMHCCDKAGCEKVCSDAC